MEPEIMKFQASQKLLNPNLSSAGTHIERINLSPLEHNKLKILVKLFVDKNELKNVKLEFEEQLSLQQLTPIIFEKAELSSENYDLQSIDVLDKKSDEYITVNDEYLLQTFDKFQVHLVKKEQHLETVAIVSQSDNEEQQKLSIDTSKVKTIKQLSEFLSTQLNIKNGNIVIQKFDDDFGENIDVDEEDKFDPTKTYNIQVTKILKFDVLVAPELDADLSGEKDETTKLRPKIEENGFPASSVNASRNMSSNTSGGFPAPVYSNKNAPSVEVNGPRFSGDKKLASKVAASTSSSVVFEKKSAMLADLESEMLKIESITDCLDNLTSSSYKEISDEFIKKCVWKDLDVRQEVVERIFENAIEKPSIVGIYADLCLWLYKAQKAIEGSHFQRLFHDSIIKKCQSIFENREKIKSTEKEFVEEQNKEDKDFKKLAVLNENKKIENMNSEKVIGTLRFMSHLYRVDFLNYKIIHNCVVILIRNAEEGGSELMIEYAVTLMKHVGPFIVQRKEDICEFDGYVTYLQKFKEAASDQIKFSIDELTEFRDRNWIGI